MSCASLVEPDCPIPRAHQRLEEAHRLWHQTAAGYASPVMFRARLNDTLKALRGGTWALQQETRAGHGFDEWHAAWHQRVRGDDVLSWLLQAHRHNLTEDDLEPASSAHVTLMAGAAGQPLARFTVPPLVDAAQIPRRLRDSRMGGVVNEASLMVLERRWSAADLEDWELLDALAHCYEVLAVPLAEVHGRGERNSEERESSSGSVLTNLASDLLNSEFLIPNSATSVPPCMSLTRRDRMTVFRLKEGRIVELQDSVGDEIEGDRPAANAATEKLDEDPAEAKPDPLRRMAWYFEEARRALIREGTYPQRVSLFVQGQEWVASVLSLAELQDRYQLWGRIAHEVARGGAIAVMTSFEIAPRKPGESGRLVLAAETSEGQHRTLSATFERRGSQLRFGRTRVDEDGRRWYFLDPVRETWAG